MNEEQQYKILLVEDDPALVRLVLRKLRQADYAVDAARSGEEGLALAISGSYDAVIVDYSLPDRDGLSVIRQLVASGCDIPTMMVTGSGSEEVAVEAMRLGVGDYIVKDIVGGYLSLLPVAVRRVIAQRQLALQKEQIEEALERERAFTEVALNILPDLFYVFDMEGRLLRWNNAVRLVSGYSDEEIASMKVTDAFLEEDRPRLEAAIQRTLVERSATVEATFVAKDGTQHCFEMAGSVLRDAEGQPLAFCGFARDIGQRREAEAALRASEEKFRTISESALDAMIMTQSQKLESMGRLAAGIADEIDTPAQYVGDNTQRLQDAFEQLGSVLQRVDSLIEAAASGEMTDQHIADLAAARRQADLDCLVEEVPGAI